MTSQDYIQISILIGLIILSAFFSSTETAFSSVNKIKLKNMIQNGHKRAKRTLNLADRFEDLIITILIGNNIANILSASIATVFFIRHWGDIGVTLSTAVMTTLVLVFGEIAPKSLAKKVPEKYALATTPILIMFLFILKPLGFIFGAIQKGLNKIFTFNDEPTITEEELLTYVSEAQQDGGINENEEELIKSVIDFDDLIVEEIFTPRVDIIAISELDESEKIIKAFRQSGFSRLPVYDTSIDHIIGVINHKDFYNLVLLEKQPLEYIIKPPVFVTEYMKVSNLLGLFKANKSHMAVVKDEFGGTLGIVTMEDVLEELVGEIWDEHDEIIEQIIKIEEHKYRVKGNAELDDVFERIGIDDDLDFSTVNGWILDEMGKIPFIGDSFHYKNLLITITSADTKRVLEATIELQNIEKELTEDVS
ncbi:HlyC/CorC family transporter [Mariniplasma anaerobium]|uniref:Hemolysin n=1 Tax=Mariniplasma anaerobium TaxID=2735436 RepID=A0A7U9TLN5_9MOLU|nr:hemolysin family protein [Mariniplasma anaerobium]BCR35999.1 hemolysin [Mariniplasma anaerobium]